mgnify:CR=1 FL=1
MDYKDFMKLTNEEMTKAYGILIKSVNVVFSGSIDPAINKLDYKKIMMNYSDSNKPSYSYQMYQ